MKHSGKCPKCNSMNIWNNSHLSMGIRPLRGWVLVSESWLRRKFAFKEEYVCIDCGYSETFIDNAGLKTIREYGVTEG